MSFLDSEPQMFSTGSDQSLLDWEREDSDHELSRLGPLTISFLDLSQLGALRP